MLCVLHVTLKVIDCKETKIWRKLSPERGNVNNGFFCTGKGYAESQERIEGKREKRERQQEGEIVKERGGEGRGKGGGELAVETLLGTGEGGGDIGLGGEYEKGRKTSLDEKQKWHKVKAKTKPVN